MVEEAYEALAAIRDRDDANLCEELGDVLLLIVMQAEIAREEGRFDIKDVIAAITEKLIRRHPHVFGTSKVGDSAGVVRQWDTIKREEKKGHKEGYLGEAGAALPALMRAQKLQKKAARVNFDWADLHEVIAKVDEELEETKRALAAQNSDEITNEMGDLLFAVVNLARKNGLDAESILQAATDKFVQRFNRLEEELEKTGTKLGEANLEEMDAIWNKIKDSNRRPM
jgi:MazG family protein